MCITVVSIVVRGGTNIKEGRWDVIYYITEYSAIKYYY